MDITQLAQKPHLIQVSLDSDSMLKKYGDTVDFFCWDRISASDFIQINLLSNHSDPQHVSDTMSKFILDEHGDPVITKDTQLPLDILFEAIGAISKRLGKFLTPAKSTANLLSFA